MNLLFNDSAYPTYTRVHMALFRHMLATPLTTLEYLFDQFANSNNSKTIIKKETINTCFKRIKETLDYFTKTRPRKADTFTIESLLSTIAIYYGNEGKKITFGYQSEECKKLQLTTSRFLLEEVFICLINNAFEAQVGHTNPFVVITVFRKKSNIFFIIRDYGCGIPWWKQFIVKTPLVSFKNNGSGLGLSFAQQVISSAFQGDLRVYSNGLGTEVICSLPLHR